MSNIVKIFLLSVLIFVIYCVAYNFITLAICPEIFKIRAECLKYSGPVVYAVFDGGAIGLFYGALFGFALAVASQAGKWPKVTVSTALWPFLYTLIFSSLASVATCAVLYVFATDGSLKAAFEEAGKRDRCIGGIDAEWRRAYLMNAQARSISDAVFLISLFVGPAALFFNRHSKVRDDPQARPEPFLAESHRGLPAIKILFLAANPKDTDWLRVTEEAREIRRGLRDADLRDQFVLEQEYAVRLDELPGHLLRHRPHVVHFSGHCSAAGKIILEDASGNSNPVTPQALTVLFGALREDNIRCVVLNACYTEAQASGIVESIECVIGMSGPIPDKSAIAFATSFYQTIGYGRSIKTAFDLACVAIDRPGPGKEASAAASDNPARDAKVKHTPSSRDDTPKLKVKVGVDPAEIYLAVNTITARALPPGGSAKSPG